jgi:hypothetical protein
MKLKIKVLKEGKGCVGVYERCPHMGCSKCCDECGRDFDKHGDEASMARTNLMKTMKYCDKLLHMIRDEDDLPEWVDAKITKATDYLSSVKRYLYGEIAREEGMLEERLSEGMKYHMDNNITIDKNIYRIHSENFFSLFKEARDLWKRGLVNLTEAERYYISETQIGEFGIFEGEKVPLDFPMAEESLLEAKYKGKDVKLNKPQRGGSKKFYVYVRDPKTKNIRKVSFGDKGMSVKVADPERRKSFAARHKCKQKKDKTKAGYWACRIGRYPHLTGSKKRFTWW